MHMDVAAAVVAVGMGANNRLMPGKMIDAESLTQLLRRVYRQAVIVRVLGIKAYDVVMAFHVLPLLVFPVAEIGAHAGHREVLFVAVQCGDAVVPARNKPAVLIAAGFHGEFVMLKGEVYFGGGIVSILRAYMFERCQGYHRPFSSHQI